MEASVCAVVSYFSHEPRSIPPVHSTMSATSELIIPATSTTPESIRASVSSAFASLGSGGVLTVTYPSSVDASILTSQLTLCGFTGVTPASSTSVTATKPAWASSGGSLLKSRGPRAPQASAPEAVLDRVVLVTPSTQQAALVDENALLAGEDFSEGKATTAGGCAPTRKACANCSCG